MATGAAVAAVGIDATKVLLERDAGFLRDAGGIGIDRPEKILDLLLHLALDDLDLASLWWGDLPRLDLVLHFRLHSYHPRRATRIVVVNTWGTDKFRCGEERPKISQIAGPVNSTLVAS